MPLTRTRRICIRYEVKLWRSGIIWSVLSFVSGLGNFVFSAIIVRRLSHGEYGDSKTALFGVVGFLSLPLSIVSTALIHHIAHFRGQKDEARLQGLLEGCQRVLLQATIAGSVLAVILANPLGRFFGYRPSLMLVALITILVGLWSGFGLTLCQGVGWFKRLAIINLAGVGMRIVFGWLMTKPFPTAEMALLATTFSLLANLSLLYWWKDIFRHGAERISPWDRNFTNFLLVTGAYVAGNWFFLSGDTLVAKKYFPGPNLDAYGVAGSWAVALPGTIAPLLLVMFTSRSGGKEGQALSDQRILLCLYAIGLACGAAGIISLRSFLVGLLCGKEHPEAVPVASAMVVPYTTAMAFVGLNQAIGLWSLASRWYKLTACYGALGLTYWLALLLLGHTPTALLHVMPIGTGAAFAVLVIAWLLSVRSQPSARPAD